MKPGDVVQVCPADNSDDTEASRLRGQYFRVIRMGETERHPGFVAVVKLESRWHVFREQDLKFDETADHNQYF